MNEFSQQRIHHTLQQAVEWVQNNPPLFNQAASPLCLDSPLPAAMAPVIPDNAELDTLACLVKKKGNPLLGIFYETLWQFLLSQSPDSHIVAANLQVNGKNNGLPSTLGEYDLLYRFKSQLIHRELAVKFYLGIPQRGQGSKGSPWRQWVGPGLKDRLDRKMDRLLHHQAVLSDTNEGQDTLSKLGIEPPVHQEILIQGRLFYPAYPLNTTEPPAIQLIEYLQSINEAQTGENARYLCPPPELCNPDHARGYWLTQHQFLLSTRFISGNLSYQLTDKFQWLNQNPAAEFLNHEALILQLKQQKRPVYIRLIHQAPHSALHLFIVPDDWPEKAVTVSEKTDRAVPPGN